MKPYILTLIVLLFVTLSLASVVISGNPLAWIDHIFCLWNTGEFGVCLLSAALFPSFKALKGHDAIAGVDYDPDKGMCQDDYEYFTGTGRYTDNPVCFICGLPANEYAALPNGDIVSVCNEHVCDEGKIIPSFSDKQDISEIADYLESKGKHSPYLAILTNALRMTCQEWKYPCYTCYTTY